MTEMTSASGKECKIDADSIQEDDDRVSVASVNFMTPSPKSFAKDIDNNENGINIEQSAIDIESDQCISSEELEIISEKCPKTCEWFINTLCYIRNLPTTKRLNRLVRLWYRIQELDHFHVVDGRNNEHKLSVASRPRFFENWMQTHRTLKRKEVPALGPIEEFLEQFQQWWSSLQPAWCTTLHSEPFTKTSPAHSDWSSLCRTGPNGLSLIILALTWMSDDIRSGNALFTTYALYIEDATWAFGEVVKWMEGGRVTDSVTNLTEGSEALGSTPPKPTKRGRPANSTSKSSKVVKRQRI